MPTTVNITNKEVNYEYSNFTADISYKIKNKAL